MKQLPAGSGRIRMRRPGRRGGGVGIIIAVLSLTAYWLTKDSGSVPRPAATPTPVVTKAVQPVSQAPVSVATSSAFLPVVRVVDGDTIAVSENGRNKTVRMIGVDTPEVVDPRKPVQCFGKEASARTKEWLTGRSVRLETDPTQGNTDKYGRLLRYVYRDDGLFVNRQLIAEGYAHEYTYAVPYAYQTEFRQAEKDARQSGAGLWAADACGVK